MFLFVGRQQVLSAGATALFGFCSRRHVHAPKVLGTSECALGIAHFDHKLLPLACNSTKRDTPANRPASPFAYTQTLRRRVTLEISGT